MGYALLFLASLPTSLIAIEPCKMLYAEAFFFPSMQILAYNDRYKVRELNGIPLVLNGCKTDDANPCT